MPKRVVCGDDVFVRTDMTRLSRLKDYWPRTERALCRRHVNMVIIVLKLPIIQYLFSAVMYKT
jgi:hypothetical protein